MSSKNRWRLYASIENFNRSHRGNRNHWSEILNNRKNSNLFFPNYSSKITIRTHVNTISLIRIAWLCACDCMYSLKFDRIVSRYSFRNLARTRIVYFLLSLDLYIFYSCRTELALLQTLYMNVLYNYSFLTLRLHQIEMDINFCGMNG